MGTTSSKGDPKCIGQAEGSSNSSSSITPTMMAFHEGEEEDEEGEDEEEEMIQSGPSTGGHMASVRRSADDKEVDDIRVETNDRRREAQSGVTNTFATYLPYQKLFVWFCTTELEVSPAVTDKKVALFVRWFRNKGKDVKVKKSRATRGAKASARELPDEVSNLQVFCDVAKPLKTHVR